jgi:tetratricopeptide (TPR) repeat protein
MMKSFILTASVAFMLAFAPQALAAGEHPAATTGTGAASSSGGSNSSGSSGSGQSTGSKDLTAPSPKQLLCKKGEIVKTVVKDGKKEKSCVKEAAGIVPDNELYDQGRALAKQGEYDWALSVLALITDQNDPKVLNYIGYSHRKAGRLDIGITYYSKALALDPDFVLAREYLGEGYVAAGKIDLAKIQLAEIQKRCGTSCEEYKDLNAAIQTAM